MNDYGIPARLTTAETIAATSHEPTIRIRNEHSHTLKDAWRLSSTTVEMTFDMNYIDTCSAQDTLEELQRRAFIVGQEEAVRRNAIVSAEVAQ